MDIIISNSSETPIYQQVYQQVTSQILDGSLKPGDALPPIRTVAKELRVSIITIKKAWELLEREGFIDSMVGRGCFVASLSSDGIDKRKIELARQQLKKELGYYRGLGLSTEELQDLIGQMYQGPQSST